MKKTLSAVLSLALVFGLSITGPMSSATATAKLKKTLSVGEKYVFSIPDKTNSFTKVKSSKTKVATVKKTSKKKVTITAKSDGKTTITLKTKKKITYKYIITVKKRFTSWKAFPPYNPIDETTSRYTGNVMFEVVNESGVYASEASVSYELYGASGNLLSKGEQRLLEMVPGAKAHCFGIASNLQEPVKEGKITNITLTQDENAPKYKYTDRNDDLIIKEVEKADDTLKFSISNKCKEGVKGTGEVIFYLDSAATQPMGMSTFNLYTNANGTNLVSVVPAKGYATYKLIKRAFTAKYTG